MPQIDVDEPTYDALRIAANAAGVSMSEIVVRALAALAHEAPRPVADPWDEVPIFTNYAGRRVDARFLPATRRVVITSGPLAGRDFASPSAAAGAVIAATRPGTDTRANGWRFWHVASSGDYLDGLRSPGTPGARP